jgi:hypothetical protein
MLGFVWAIAQSGKADTYIYSGNEFELAKENIYQVIFL